MSKKFIIIFIIALALLAAGYWYWSSRGGSTTPEQSVLKSAADSAKTITESASQGVLPSLNVQANPLSNVPDANPVTKTNPFSGLKTNPFGK